MYARLAITRSPTGVVTEKGSKRVFGPTLTFTVIYEVTRDSVAPRYNNA